MKVHPASKKYGIPYATLHAKYNGTSPKNMLHSGYHSVLGHAVEREIVAWLLQSAQMGLPFKMDILLNSVQSIVRELKIKNSFNNDRPGMGLIDFF